MGSFKGFLAKLIKEIFSENFRDIKHYTVVYIFLVIQIFILLLKRYFLVAAFALNFLIALVNDSHSKARKISTNPDILEFIGDTLKVNHIAKCSNCLNYTFSYRL